MATPVEPQLTDQLDTLENKLYLLNVEYDKYFMGIERKPPTKELAEVEAILRQLSKATIRNTAHNFRFQNLKARFVTFNQRWTRILKQMEDGTFKRDQFKYGLKHRESEEQKKQEEQARLEAQRREEEEERARQVRDTVADKKRLETLFKDFVQKRQQCNERVDNVQFDKMVEFMQQQTKSIKEKYAAKAVEFQVVVDGGKTRLKAVPIK
ncbi:MAG: MXAN_5187 C-terminal domain-containing protein [Myxococcota bacterium]